MARILIVDDSMFMRAKLRGILEPAGHEIVGEGSNGAEAINMAKDLNPDLVTLDIVMPDMDGVIACKEVKRVRPGVKVIMVTAMGHASYVKDAVDAGASDFIVKPFKPEKVLASVERTLKA